MINDDEEQISTQAVSEPAAEPTDNQETEPTMVPLAALKAERKKRQEESQKRIEAEERSKVYENLMRQKEATEPQPEDDPNALVEKHLLKETTAITKREILESVFQDNNPKAVQEINKYLKPILEKKPWLASSVDTALNRYARAYEIVQDYIHLVEEKPVVKQPTNNDGQKIVQNAQKPRSPVEIGKSAQPGGTEYLRSIQGKKEFREYRQKVLRGDA